MHLAGRHEEEFDEAGAIAAKQAEAEAIAALNEPVKANLDWAIAPVAPVGKVTAGWGRLPVATTGWGRPPAVATGWGRPPAVATGWGRPPGCGRIHCHLVDGGLLRLGVGLLCQA